MISIRIPSALSRLLRRDRASGQAVRFLVVGLLNTVVDLGVFYLLTLIPGMPDIAAKTISYILGICNSFVWNKLWTFGAKGSGRTGREFGLFFLVNLPPLIVNIVVFSLLGLWTTSGSFAVREGKAFVAARGGGSLEFPREPVSCVPAHCAQEGRRPRNRCAPGRSRKGSCGRGRTCLILSADPGPGRGSRTRLGRGPRRGGATSPAPRYSVVIPIHNEAECLDAEVAELVAEMEAQGVDYELILAENGSVDETPAMCSALASANPRIQALRVPIPDYGYAMKTGMLAGRGDYIVNFDIDFHDVPFMLAAGDLLAGGAGIVVGSKLMEGAEDKRSPIRHFISYGFTTILRVLFDPHMDDTHGMKALRREVVQQYAPQTVMRQDIFDTELIIRARRGGVKVDSDPRHGGGEKEGAFVYSTSHTSHHAGVAPVAVYLVEGEECGFVSGRTWSKGEISGTGFPPSSRSSSSTPFSSSSTSPTFCFSLTTTSGGDTGAHHYPAQYLIQELLPHFRLTGWAPGWYAGMPMLTFYFPFPFLLIAILNWVLPYQIAFKLITVLGVFALPATAYAMGRLWRVRRPFPMLAAVFAVAMLFMESYSIYGGNVKSTLAGEFGYMLSFALVFLFLGTMYRGMEKPHFNMLFVLNCLILMALVLSHIVPTIALVFISPGLLLVNPRWRSFGYLAAVALIGFALTAFWSLPFAANLEWTAHMAWDQLGWKELLPPALYPVAALAIIGAAYRCRQAGEQVAPSALDELDHRPGLQAPSERTAVECSRRALLVHVAPSVGRLRRHLVDPAVHRGDPRPLRRKGMNRRRIYVPLLALVIGCGGHRDQRHGDAAGSSGTTPGTRARTSWPQYQEINDFIATLPAAAGSWSSTTRRSTSSARRAPSRSSPTGPACRRWKGPSWRPPSRRPSTSSTRRSCPRRPATRSSGSSTRPWTCRTASPTSS